ncbi:MAG TPA: hypothetical protein VF961_00915 [Pyrinomonadaceae bacterium]
MNKSERANDDINWTAVIARCLAFLCLDKADLRTEKVSVQAQFLERLGLRREDAARILDTSAESLRVLAQREKSKKGHRRGKK